MPIPPGDGEAWDVVLIGIRSALARLSIEPLLSAGDHAQAIFADLSKARDMDEFNAGVGLLDNHLKAFSVSGSEAAGAGEGAVKRGRATRPARFVMRL